MNEPITTLDTRHGVPRGGVTPWEETRRVLETAELFWLSTVRADGRPHVTPCVPVWHDGAIHFTATVPGHSCWPQNGPFDANLAANCQKEWLSPALSVLGCFDSSGVFLIHFHR